MSKRLCVKCLWRWLPLIILVTLIFLIIYFRWYQYLSFAMLQQHYRFLQQWTSMHYVLAVMLFVLIYIVVVAVSIPGATILTLLAGFLFGPYWGALYVIISATIGATILFLIVRMSFGHWIAERAHGWVMKMEQGFQKNAFNYLLFLRLVPIFPFWVINIVPGLLNMRARQFVIATCIGIVPGTFVYALVGNGLGTVLGHHETPDLSIIFKPSVLFPILALAVLSLVPILYKQYKARRKS